MQKIEDGGGTPGDIDSPSTKAYITFTTKHRAIDLYRSRKRCEPVGVSSMWTAEIHHKWLGVIEALDSLPSRDRDMLLLRYWEGYTTEADQRKAGVFLKKA